MKKLLALLFAFALLAAPLHADGIQNPGATITAGQLPGTATNDDAAAGKLGEYLTSTGSGVAMSTGNNFNTAAVSLTAGDWDVWGYTQFGNVGATTYTMVQTGLSTTNGVFGGIITQIWTPSVLGAPYSFPTIMGRFSLSSTTTIYVVGVANFTGGTPTSGGAIYARRVR